MSSIGHTMSPKTIVRHLHQGNVGRAAVVHEKDPSGEVVMKILDVQDVEERKPDCKEIVVVDEETEKKILRSIKIYGYTIIYLAVMMTITVIIATLNYLN